MRDSFKLEDNYNKKNKKKKQNSNLFTLIICGVIAIICFGGYFIINYINTRTDYIDKKDSEKEYIYTIKKDENSFNENTYYEVPTINLVGEEFDKINENILKKYEEITTKLEYDYGYEFNQSDNILALKVTYAYYPNIDVTSPIRYFETYNIDLRNGKILSDEEILKMYKVNSEQVNNFLKAKFERFYIDLVNAKFYTEKECNYKCFLKNRGISDNYLNGISYYIEDGSLTLFKYFYTNSDYSEELYFKNTNYQFIVKE